MTSHEFNTQINRLKDCFTDRSYSDERMKVIWREVQDLDGKWFAKVVDRFIGECRQAPLMTEFREEIAKERERLWELQKKHNAKDAKDFMSGIYQPDDIKTICQYIVKRVSGGVSDQDFSSFIKHLDTAAEGLATVQPIQKCSTCQERGLIFVRYTSGYEFVYRCTCLYGQRHSKGIPVIGSTTSTTGGTYG